MPNSGPKPQEILGLVFDALSDETIDELNKLTPFLLAYYMTNREQDQEHGRIRNIIMRSHDPINDGIKDVNSFYYDPVESGHTDIDILKSAIETGDNSIIKNTLQAHTSEHGDKDVRRIASLVLEQQINTIIKKPTFGASIMIQNAIGKMLDGEHLLDRIKFQIFIEVLMDDKIYYNEQIIEIDKAEFLENPLKLAEHNSIDNPGIRSADGSGIEFHKQLFGPFAELVST